MKNLYSKILSFILPLSLLVPHFLFAAIGEGKKITLELDNPIKAENFLDLLDQVVDLAMYIAIPIIVIAIIYAGFLFVKARGKEKEITDAKNVLMYVVIGSAIILGAELLKDIVVNTITSLK